MTLDNACFISGVWDGFTVSAGGTLDFFYPTVIANAPVLINAGLNSDVNLSGGVYYNAALRIIECDNCDDIRVNNTTFQGFEDGIFATNANSLEVKNSTIHANRHGIFAK